MKTIFISLFLASSLWIFGQTTYTVDNNPSAGANFTSVQAAINAATAGDSIYIHPSATTYGDITISKTIHLRGLGHRPEFNAGEFPTLGNISFNGILGAPNSSISGLFITGNIQISNVQNYSGLSVSNNRLHRISGSNTLNQSNDWLIAGNVFITSSFALIDKANSSNWMIINNFIQNNGTSVSWNTFTDLDASDIFRNNIIVSHQNGEAITVFVDCQNLTVENSIFITVGTATGITGTSSSITYNNCLSFSSIGQTLSALNGSDNLNNQDPQFVNGGTTPTFSYSKDFHLADGSPGADHGLDGEDIGIYGNSYPFSMEGYPEDLPYPTSLVIENSVISNGGTLNVLFEAEGN